MVLLIKTIASDLTVLLILNGPSDKNNSSDLNVLLILNGPSDKNNSI